MIENKQQFNQLLMIKLQVALDNTMEICLNELIKIIEEEVYNSYEPKWYERTSQFLESWEKTVPVIKGNIVESDIWQKFETMVWDMVELQHGNNSEPLGDKALAEIINYGKAGQAFGFPQLGARPFWDVFLDWTKTNINNIFAIECKKQGF